MKSIIVTSSILILVITALRPLLRGKIDPRAQYALWLIAALRLLLPVELAPSAFSALSLLDRAEEQTHLVQAIGQTPIPVRSYQSAYDQALREYEQENGPITSAGGYEGLQDYELVDYRAAALMEGPTLAQLAEAYARPVWLTGAAVTAAWFLLVNLRLRRKLRAALPAELDCPLPVYVTPAIPSPCLCGAVRPAVYVTPGALASPDRTRHVLAHELTHYRHRDHWWSWVRCLCLCLYWFNPLVWWAAALSRQDCELACDEGAIRRLGEDQRIPYGRTLVDMIAAGRNPLLQTATTMTGSKRRVMERIRLIARRPRTAAALALAAALILTLAVGCTFTGAAEDPTASSGPAPEESSPAQVSIATIYNGPRLPEDTLKQRLLDLPQELQGDVEASATKKDSVNNLSLVTYWLKDPAGWPGGEPSSPWIADIQRWEYAQFENYFYGIPTGAYSVFARDGECFYVYMRSTDARCAPADEERYSAMRQAVMEYAMDQVLRTEGVEPFDEETARGQEYLHEGKTYMDVAYWPYKMHNGSTGVVWIFRMYQPVTQGDGGVWITERVEYCDTGNSPYQTGFDRPDTEGLTLAEYAANLQAQADAGEAGWATDPIEVLRRNVAYHYSHENVPRDSFTTDEEYIQQVRADAIAYEQSTPEQEAVQAVMTDLAAAMTVHFELDSANAGKLSPYPYTCVGDLQPDGYWAQRITTVFPDTFRWQALTQEEAEAYIALGSGVSLTITEISPISSRLPGHITVYQDAPVVSIRMHDGETAWYLAPDKYSFRTWTPFEFLRDWYDEAELTSLRATTVPDRGQSHEEVVLEWIEGYEGAMTKCTPGGAYTCTYTRPQNVRADCHSDLSEEDMASFAKHANLPAEEYGKTWFTFSYELVFVPENDTAQEHLQAGNTTDFAGYYPAEDAPEGAQFWMRVAYMRLVDGNWVCEGAGTGW